MGKPHPFELRERVVAFVEEGHSHRSAASRFRVSVKFVNDTVILKRETGGLQPRRQGNGGGRGKLEPVRAWLEARMRDSFSRLHGKVLELAGNDAACKRLMTIPGVGPVTALAFICTVDIPARFRSSRSVGPALGLTPVLKQSGESERVGRVSLCGDGMMRGLLYEAAQSMLTRVKKWSWLKAWAMTIARRGGLKKAVVALARRISVIMHRMWIDGSEFRWSRDGAAEI
jgi:transposase